MRKISSIMILLVVPFAASAFGQPADSVPTAIWSTVFETRMEMTDWSLGAEFSVGQYWRNLLGIHLTGGLEFNGGYSSLGAGLSLQPIPYLLAEADIGVASSNEGVVDAPSFSPDYVTHLRAGVLIPLGRSEGGFAVTMTGNLTTLVDNSGGTGGFPPPVSMERVSAGPHRVVREFSSFLLGLRWRM